MISHARSHLFAVEVAEANGLDKSQINKLLHSSPSVLKGSVVFSGVQISASATLPYRTKHHPQGS